MKDATWYNGNSDRAMLPIEQSPWLPLYKAAAGLLPHPDGAVPILDLGCGTGRFAKLLHNRGYTAYTGVDFATALLSEARKYNKGQGYSFKTLDVYNAGELIEKHSLIVMLELLEHLEYDKELLEMITPGSQVIISVPNHESESHLRIFPDFASCKARYGDILDIGYGMRVKLSPTKWWTVFEAVRK
jgi:2-polyprenyl-3-methyl-5-hydroxy-6-metoxy-1,4-benzoquinol methylase